MEEKKRTIASQLKVISAKKEMYFLRVQKLYDFSQNLDNASSLKNFIVKLKTLEGTQQEFIRTVELINELQLKLDEEYIPNFQALEAFDDLYCAILSAAKDPRVKVAMGENINVPFASKVNEIQNVAPRLPKLSLPTFSGNIQEWPTFFECFKSLIHVNDNLNDVDKINYLVGQLSGKAKNICAGLPPIGSNYKIIWDALVEKYQNPRALANSYIEQILEFKPAQIASTNNLNYILEKCDSAFRALQKLEIEDLLDFTYAYLLWSKLDSETRTLFENTRRKLNLLTYNEVVNFIKEQVQIYAMSAGSSKSSTSHYNKTKPQAFFVENSRDAIKCVICQSKQHDVLNCNRFLSKLPSERFKIIKKKNLCINCFGNHKVLNCKSSSVCKVCKYKHNTLLHYVKTPVVVTDNMQDNDQYIENKVIVSKLENTTRESVDQGGNVSALKPSTSTFCSTVDIISNRNSSVLLSTVVVYIWDKRGNQHKIRFLLDSASESNFLTTKCAKQLQLDTYACDWSVKGIGGRESFVKGAATTVIYSRFDSNVCYTLDVLLVDKVTDRLPDNKIPNDSLTHLRNLPLADATFTEPTSVDGIIGAQLFPVLLGSRKVSGSLHQPIAIETKLGYVVMGYVPTVTASSKSVKAFHTTVEPSLDKLVSKFWEVEDIPSQKFEHPDNLECESFYSSSVQREQSGRYVVKLPFKFSASQLGDSYSTALKRFYSLENKFDKSPIFREQYSSIIREYLSKGYMSLLKDISSAPNYYIPHHAVYKATSISTPIRCVFDASCKTTTQVSLNCLLFSGPKLQSDVLNLFLNFRLFPIAFTADIRQMYLRIGVHPDHRRFQQILCRFSKDEEVSTYSLKTVTFGVKSSPFLALRTLKQLANDELSNYPLASKIVQRDFFMDDLVSSVPSLEQARVLYWQLVRLFESGQFQLTQWAVNSKELLDEIPESDRSQKLVSFDADSLKVLGLQWYPNSDIFTFSICTEFRACTKRNILSTVARLFDPLGFLSPVTLMIKLIIKTLWTLNLDWDEVPKTEISDQWQQLQGELILLSNFRIPRHLGVTSDSKIILVGFCDACLNSFGAVTYIKTISPKGNVFVKLFCAKTKVAPMRVQSIPRLELCAANLLAKLLDFVKNSLVSRVVIEKVFAFSDSTVALSWIASPPYRWHTFVANRVAQIQQLVPSEYWFHINGKNNISDCLSRGMKPAQFLATDAWTEGPDWLKLDTSLWPIQTLPMQNDGLPEQRVSSFVIKKNYHPLLDLITRCSSWSRLVRSTVYVLRFLRILNSSELITATDLEMAEIALIKTVQKHHFSDEISLLEKEKLVSSSFRSLSPFLQDGLIRVGGRLGNSRLHFDKRHPVLLPKNNHFVDLLIDNCHKQNFHTGPTLVLSILRQNYWIIGASNAVRYRLRKCNHCFKFNPKNTFPKMADLPAVRVTEAKPFLHVGVDFGGPFYITLSRKRGVKSQKAYLCLFICLSTKSIHLELVSDLSTDLFLAAFKRFLSRRGACSVVYSDNGTNFIGAKNELDELYILMNSDNYKRALSSELTNHKIVWKFQPPVSPHFSGVWESQIKVVKSHLYKVIGSQILSYEELNTVLTQIEALLNSRPLSWMSSDPSDPIPLSPAHFLTLTPLSSLPAPEQSNPPRNLLDRKKLLDHLVQGFWTRWKNDYLTQLQLRQKWNTPGSTIKVGTLVIIKQDNIAPLQWPVGIVEELFPGPDGITRVVNVRTKTGIYKRPVVRLCPLPSQ